jgi:drug/metabolite transporter (DMT)-like permease
MRAGVLLCVLGAFSFGLLACVSKVAQRKNCNSSALVVWLFGWATLVMLGRSLTISHPAHVTAPVTAIAILFGICAAVGYLAFQISIAVGKVTVGWLMMNLSSGIPALVSIWLYAEKLTLLKSIAFGLAVLSLICLFQGNRLEARLLPPAERR